MRSKANRGRAFEQYLELLHGRYRVQHLAVIDKVPTPTKPIRNAQGHIIWVPTRRGIADFVGLAWTPAGAVPVAFDAKQRSGKTGFRVKREQMHQFDYLFEFYSLGGCAFYLVQASDLMDRVFICPLPFDPMQRQRFEAMAEVEQDWNGWHDYLPVALRVWQARRPKEGP